MSSSTRIGRTRQSTLDTPLGLEGGRGPRALHGRGDCARRLPANRYQSKDLSASNTDANGLGILPRAG
jgi:hypothetical protein